MKLVAIAAGLFLWPVMGQRLDCDPTLEMRAAAANNCTDQFACLADAGAVGTLQPRCYYPSGWGYGVAPGNLTGTVRHDEEPEYPIRLTPTGGATKRFLSISKEDADETYDTALWDVLLRIQFEGAKRLRLLYKPIDATSGDPIPRYEIPEEIIKLNAPSAAVGDPHYVVTTGQTSDNLFSLVVNRRSDNGTELGAEIFKADLPGFTFENQFIEISMRCPTEFVYGFGEHEHHTLKHFWDYVYLPMLTTPTGVGGHDGNNTYLSLYGHHPFFMGFDEGGSAYGVLFWNSNAQEVFLQPENIMTFRTIGGVLDIRIMTGPSPAEVFSQYHSMIGTPYFPPYWSLGFQLSKYYYGSLSNLTLLHERMTKYEIPWDVQQLDIDYMDRQRAFTTDNGTEENFLGLRTHVDKLHADGMKFVIILDPAITGNDTNWEPEDDEGTPDPTYHAWVTLDRDDLHVKFIDAEKDDPSDNSTVVYGKVWPDFPNSTLDECHTEDNTWDENIIRCRAWSAWPDFGLQETSDWWVEESRNFWMGDVHDGYDYGEGVRFDGIWIDMNEPENFVGGDMKYDGGCTDDLPEDNMPYRTHHQFADSYLAQNSVCMSAQQRWGTLAGGQHEKYSFYDTRSLYSHSMARPSLAAANSATGQESGANLRSMIFSRATFAGTGSLIGHWLGDNPTSWESMKRSIIGILEFNMFGVGYVGADICGFFRNGSERPQDKASPQLCYRWMQLGAFYTFSRNHATKHKTDQDPAAYGDENVDGKGQLFVDGIKRALKAKYEVMPYLYTTMYQNNRLGGTTLKAMWEPFYDDQHTWAIDEQFMYGPAIMVSPILHEDFANTTSYFPSGRWYDFYTHVEEGYEERDNPRNVTLVSDPVDFAGDIPLHYRGGYIIPHQVSNTTLTASRLNPMYIVVALDLNNKATGQLHWDSGDSVIENPGYESLDVYFSYSDGAFTAAAIASPGYNPQVVFDTVYILGYRDWAISVEGESVLSHTQDVNKRILTFKLNNQPIQETFSIRFKGYYGHDAAAPPRAASAALATALAVVVAAAFAFRE